MSQDLKKGDTVEVTIGKPAHGGHAVARLDGRVIFVRHALPDERVVVRLTETAKKGFWRGDAIEILEPSPDRVPSAWPQAGPNGVGGAELAHASLPAQRAWKADVLAEQLSRLAKIDLRVPVQAIPGDDDANGMGWRTRVSLIAGKDGRAGMRKFRSHDVVALDSVPLATPAAADLLESEHVFTRSWRPRSEITTVAPANGAPGILVVDGHPWHHGRADTRPNSRRSVEESVRVTRSDGKVDEFTYRVSATGFWQVHRAAADTLVTHVLNLLESRGALEGADVLDLYAGAGLFTLPLADRVGPRGQVTAVESGKQAIRDARRNLQGHRHVDFHLGRVEQVLLDPELGNVGRANGAGQRRPDAVVLDPPRSGAGREVVDAIAALDVPTVVYVACDPASLARDIATFTELGYTLSDLAAFDIFPATHHFESVALLVRD